jgi:hypothetical protein
MEDNSSTGGGIHDVQSGDLTEKFNDPDKGQDDDKDTGKGDGKSAPPLPPPEPTPPDWQVEHMKPRDRQPKGPTP